MPYAGTMEELAQLYGSFRRIPVYIAVMMVFVIIQFIVVALLGGYVAFQMRRIADAIQAGKQLPQPHPGTNPYLQSFGGQPPQYGPYGPRNP